MSTLNHAPMAIFDFDGTIADSLDLAIAEYNRLAPRFRVRPLSTEALPRLRAMKAQAVMKEYGVSYWKLPFLVRSMRAAMREHAGALRPFPDIISTLRALAGQGCRCSILSTNSNENIGRFLARNELTLFEHIAGGSSMFGKERALKKLIQRARLDASAVYYIGDEVRDVTAANAAGVRSIAVSWGYAAREALVAHAPDHVVDQPAQLISLLTPRD
jgi:phosphoglycolate phosphatase-like HAD superfamily hydrolase